MVFENSNIPQSVNLLFNWVADYFDGTSISEYDFKTHKSNDFYSIKQNEVYRFGLIGMNNKYYFETVDGHFHLQGRRVEIAYEQENGKTIHLTNNPNKKDLITYKQAYTFLNRNQIQQRSNIESINFGYKTNINADGANIHFQTVVSFPFNNASFMEVKLTSDQDMDGHIAFYVRGKEVERFKAPLKRGSSGRINWIIKI